MKQAFGSDQLSRRNDILNVEVEPVTLVEEAKR